MLAVVAMSYEDEAEANNKVSAIYPSGISHQTMQILHCDKFHSL